MKIRRRPRGRIEIRIIDFKSRALRRRFNGIIRMKVSSYRRFRSGPIQRRLKITSPDGFRCIQSGKIGET